MPLWESNSRRAQLYQGSLLIGRDENWHLSQIFKAGEVCGNHGETWVRFFGRLFFWVKAVSIDSVRPPTNNPKNKHIYERQSVAVCNEGEWKENGWAPWREGGCCWMCRRVAPQRLLQPQQSESPSLYLCRCRSAITMWPCAPADKKQLRGHVCLYLGRGGGL